MCRIGPRAPRVGWSGFAHDHVWVLQLLIAAIAGSSAAQRTDSVGVEGIHDVMPVPPLHRRKAHAQATTRLVVSARDLVLAGGASIIPGHGAPTGFSLRSGDPGQTSTAVFPTALALAPSATITAVSVAFRYVTGYEAVPSGLGANLSLAIGALQTLYSSPHLTDYAYSHNESNYSAPVVGRWAGSLNVNVSSDTTLRFEMHFQNNDRNIQVLLPFEVNVTCVGVAACLVTAPAPVPPPPAPPSPAPVEVFLKGENVTGWNPDNDTRVYNCFRIPQLLALPSGRLLAFAEGRADGCRPDVNVNRPIVVRGSSDGGATWGPIAIAGPALTHSGTNYPGAFWRDNATVVVLRYGLSNGSVFETTSSDEGVTWSAPAEASQPDGARCGSAWPVMVGAGVVMACGNGTMRSTDGGRSWVRSRLGIATAGTNVTGLGEMMPVADGRTSTSLTMMIRAASRNRWLNHAIAQSDDLGDTWGPARLLPIVGTTCEGSAGRDVSAPPGQVLLAATYGANRYYLGRGNMTVFSLNGSVPGADPVPRINVWPNAAGYSAFAQVPGGPVMLLFEGGGSVYDYGIKIAPVVLKYK